MELKRVVAFAAASAWMSSVGSVAAHATDEPNLRLHAPAEPWPHLFPLLDKGAAERGVELPQPIGIGLNYMYLVQDVNIDRIALSLNENPTREADFIKFHNVRSAGQMVTVRPDLWLFPFLNVYGILGVGNVKGTVLLESPVELQSVVQQTARVWGFGLTTAFGFEGFWLSADVNWTWVALENLIDPVSGRVLGLRLGKAFELAHGHSFSLWGGAMQQSLVVSTRGHIRMDEALSQDSLDQLGQALASACDNLTGASAAACNRLVGQYDPASFGANVVNYDLDKSLATPWNALLGAQFALDEHWLLRSELGFIGRYSLLLSFNYRFGLGLAP